MVTPDPQAPAKRRGAPSPAVVFAILILLSLPLRLFHLNAPLTGEHEFRQTQTALSVWEIREHGFSLLHPKLALFGPPWECPLEYPVFQTVAAAVDAIAPWNNLDVSIRLTNLAFFYLTAIALYLLARLLFAGAGVALFTSAVFLFAPYNIFWSRASMVEYAATFFALAYLYLFIRWTKKPSRLLFGLAVVTGILGCLTKVTTFVMPLFIAGSLAGLLALRLLLEKRKSAKPAERSDTPETQSSSETNTVLRPIHVVFMACMLFIPAGVGHAYIKYSDTIKRPNAYTAWLTSDHPYMKSWTQGTLAQRLSARDWNVVVTRLRMVGMASFTLAALIGLVFIPLRMRGFETLPGGNLLFGLCLVLAPLIMILIFFNLYRIHTYYFIACSPMLALFTGAGLAWVFSLIKRDFIQVLFVLFLGGIWLHQQAPQVARSIHAPGEDRRVKYLVEASARIGKDEPVIIVSAREWSAFAPYHLKRRAFMPLLINKPVDFQPYLDTNYFKHHGFRWLLVEGAGSGTAEMTAKITNQWKTVTLVPLSITNVSYGLYTLSDE